MCCVTIFEEPYGKTPVMQPSTKTNSEWLKFQKEIRGKVDSMNKKLDELKKGQKKSRKLLRRVLKLLYNLNDNVEGNPTTAYHVSYKHVSNVQKDDSDAMKIDSDDLQFGPQDDGFLDSDIGVVADNDVKAALDFLNADKVIVYKDEEKEDEEEYEEKEENEDDKQENDEGKEEEKKLEAAKEIDEEKKDEEAKGKEEETNDVEIAMEQDKEERKNEEVAKEQINDQIPKQKRSRFSRLRQKRSGPLVESGSTTHAPTKMVIFYALPRGLSDEPPKKNLEQKWHALYIAKYETLDKPQTSDVWQLKN
ncbi:hypothetical protein TIFTF001_016788 [Ficus carica]|uniref:Uncharacterized protein n=1 Tax=Ficus carica TaxID=3494 RepID=A0AA88API1_FICCA|nr:hypothetical protein TIFTF001_016788 [Ficus carica]